jgi:hypothetical protein
MFLERTFGPYIRSDSPMLSSPREYGVIEGTVPCPVTPVTTGGNQTAATDSDKLTTWKKDEALALELLTQRIPDSTIIRTSNQLTAAVIWAKIVHEYMEKGAYVQTDLYMKFLESKCVDKGDV